MELNLTLQSIDRRNDMTTRNRTNDRKMQRPMRPGIYDLPKCDDLRELTPDE